MRKWIAVLSALCLSALAATPAAAWVYSFDQMEEWEVNAFVGQRMMNKSDWEPVETPKYAGVEVCYVGDSWPAWLVVGASYLSADEDLDGFNVKLDVYELSVGARKFYYIRSAEWLRPYVGANAIINYAELDTEERFRTVNDSGMGFGVSGGLGVMVTLGGHLNIGVDGRYALVSSAVGRDGANAGGLDVRGLVGIHW